MSWYLLNGCETSHIFCSNEKTEVRVTQTSVTIKSVFYCDTIYTLPR